MKALLIAVYYDLKTNQNSLTRFAKSLDKNIIQQFENTIDT